MALKWPLNEINDLIAKAYVNGEHYGVAVIDIDYMIRFCLKFAPDEINAVMQKFLFFLIEAFPSNAKIWKSAGDEFLIFVPGTTKGDLLKMTESVRKSFKRIKFASGICKDCSNITFSFSAGVAACPEDGQDACEIIRKATVALFLAKAYRRNRVYPAPEKSLKGAERILAMPDGEIRLIIGKYGETGCVENSVGYRDAYFWEPQSIDTDKDGNLYVVDQNNHTILRFDGKHVSRIVGDGSYGYTGDGGNAEFARLNKPTGLAVFQKKLYITDTGNDVVRVVDLDTGVIMTAAGTGKTGFSGNGVLAITADLNKPGGAAVDAEGNLYINDIANNVIRKVDRFGIITTYAGSGKYGDEGDGGLAEYSSFAEVYGICVDKRTSDLYIADYFNHCVRMVEQKTGKIKRVAGIGKCGYGGDGKNPLNALLNRPVAVATDIHGNLFIAESGNHCVRVIPAGASRIFTLVGDGICGIGEPGAVSKFRLANPNGLATDDRFNLYILDGANNRICRMDYSALNQLYCR